MHDPIQRGPKFFLIVGLALFLFAPFGAQADDRFPKPPSVAKRVEFWKRVYTEANTDSGFLHDAKDLSVVYEKIQVGTTSGRARERKLKPAKARYSKILTKLGKGVRSGLSKEERRVLDLFPEGTSNATFRASAKRVRFQLGQANRFRDGLVRMGRWEPFIRDVLREHGLPEELIAIPHVESSYNPNALSHAGASGIWQFTRGTGRQFMRVNHYIDERRDPFLATVAAARLFKRNYEITNTWPLAITSYNHGAAGMRRAARRLGTKDIGTITEKYKSRTFGFASRNFYASFLAALEIEKNPERYFPGVEHSPAESRQVIALDAFYQASTLTQALDTPADVLKSLNPSLLAPVWSGQKHIPKGYLLRVPRNIDPAPRLAALPEGARYAAQPRDRFYRVRRGDTLSTIARRFGVSQRALVRANSLRSKHRIRVGQRLEIPGRPGAPVNPPVLAKAPGANLAQRAPMRYKVRRGDNLAKIASVHGVSISAIQRENRLSNRNRIIAGQVLRIPGHTAPPRPGPGPAERPTHYVVRRGDSLHHIARRFGVSIAELVEWNGIGRRRIIHPGQQLRLRPDDAGEVARAPEATSGATTTPGDTASDSTTEPAETKTKVAPALVASDAAAAKIGAGDDATASEGASAPAPETVDPAMPAFTTPQLDTSARSPGASRPSLSDEPVAPAQKPTWGQPSAKRPEGAEYSLLATPDEEEQAFHEAFPASPSPTVDPSQEQETPSARPLLTPGAAAALPRDPGRYALNGSELRVEPEETLGHYADWLEIRASTLRRLNQLSAKRALELGQRVQLDFSKISPETFEARRLAHHRALQEKFFATFEVADTSEHVLRKGETIWELSRRGMGVPVWLLQAHNPEVDFGSLRVGERLRIPRVAPAGS